MSDRSTEDAAGQEMQSGVAAVDRALSIVAVFETSDGPLTISEISRRTGLYKSTALRLIGSLKRFGYIIHTEDGRYDLGPAVVRLAARYQHGSQIAHRIEPVLKRLVERGSESASFFVRQDDDTRLCILRVNSNHSTLDRVTVGTVRPLDRGAGGYLFQAYGPGPHSDKVVAIREAGFAVSYCETSPDCAAVAAPVLDHKNALVGVLQLSGPMERFTPERVEGLIVEIRAAATEISRSFGAAM
ncbi:IclR family transcriptional regulator [Rhizobium sp. AG855]|uniref:IclR family transcriptional regulator n=1 Tax=Rhizobium sp. AG855 TaxID=2183898 RepID=UPI000E730C4F|nr:IclR family transcriptional regulator [Rhizobium sp. AG855]RKE79309.1 IclR family transcriptional regulator [Rhizobium sp. AG855]